MKALPIFFFCCLNAGQMGQQSDFRETESSSSLAGLQNQTEPSAIANPRSSSSSNAFANQRLLETAARGNNTQSQFETNIEEEINLRDIIEELRMGTRYLSPASRFILTLLLVHTTISNSLTILAYQDQNPRQALIICLFTAGSINLTYSSRLAQYYSAFWHLIL